jgi:nucleoid DNA-binding protein
MRMTHAKYALDLQVARDVRLPVKTVAVVTQTFIDSLRSCIASAGKVTIEGLGRFTVKVSNGTGTRLELTSIHRRKHRVVVPRTIRVHFAKSQALKEELAINAEKAHEQQRRSKPRGYG